MAKSWRILGLIRITFLSPVRAIRRRWDDRRPNFGVCLCTCCKSDNVRLGSLAEIGKVGSTCPLMTHCGHRGFGLRPPPSQSSGLANAVRLAQHQPQLAGRRVDVSYLILDEPS